LSVDCVNGVTASVLGITAALAVTKKRDPPPNPVRSTETAAVHDHRNLLPLRVLCHVSVTSTNSFATFILLSLCTMTGGQNLRITVRVQFNVGKRKSQANPSQ
jgi:hypothetical protein